MQNAKTRGPEEQQGLGRHAIPIEVADGKLSRLGALGVSDMVAGSSWFRAL